MATIFPRLQITIDPELDVILRRLSAATGKPKASILRTLLREATPALLERSEALERALKAPAIAVEAMSSFLDRVEGHGRQVGLNLRRRAGRPRGRS